MTASCLKTSHREANFLELKESRIIGFPLPLESTVLRKTQMGSLEKILCDEWSWWTEMKLRYTPKKFAHNLKCFADTFDIETWWFCTDVLNPCENEMKREAYFVKLFSHLGRLQPLFRVLQRRIRFSHYTDNTIQYNSIQYNSIQYNTIQQSLFFNIITLLIHCT